MNVSRVFRKDNSNVGDWFSEPGRYFDLGNDQPIDILDFEAPALRAHVVVGGGGLVAKTFHDHMRRLAEARAGLKSMVAWGIGESEHVDRKGGFVLPYAGKLPEYLRVFDLVGVRDYGTGYPWVPCASCMLPQFDKPFTVEHEVVVYEHKRIPIPTDATLPRRTNAGNDIDATLSFLGSGRVVVTNSYHGAYWATLLGRRVVAIPNMSKMYRMRHAPVICRADQWRRFVDLAPVHENALSECRDANRQFNLKVQALIKG